MLHLGDLSATPYVRTDAEWRQARQWYGVRRILSSQWKANDYESGLLMRAFYENLHDDPALALQLAMTRQACRSCTGPSSVKRAWIGVYSAAILTSGS